MTLRDVEPALVLWDGLADGHIRLVNHSENHTFQIDTAGLGSFMLRVHRPGYQSRASIESELAWLEALGRDTTLAIPQPVRGRDGQLLQSFATVEGLRFAVLVQRIAGSEPDPVDDLSDLFVNLGTYAATLHRHAIAWQRPADFQRPAWRAKTILDPDGLWGDWRGAPGVTAHNRPVLDRLTETLAQRLAAYGTDPDRYGLIHADMRLGNVLVYGNAMTLIDFDDCGFCWFAYDFAAAISFHETSAAIPGLKANWLAGYLQVRTLSPDDLAIIDSVVMLRRMALLAWIGSHGETTLAQHHAPGFADGTVHLAERYLRGPLWP